MIPVRLCDIDLNVRLAAARRLARSEADQGALLDLMAAAANPSTCVYWISETAAKGLPYLLSTGQGDTIRHDDGNGCSGHEGNPADRPLNLESA